MALHETVFFSFKCEWILTTSVVGQISYKRQNSISLQSIAARRTTNYTNKPEAKSIEKNLN